jgi:hypothetical protein
MFLKTSWRNDPEKRHGESNMPFGSIGLARGGAAIGVPILVIVRLCWAVGYGH